jgi:hypothetical protein
MFQLDPFKTPNLLHNVRVVDIVTTRARPDFS